MSIKAIDILKEVQDAFAKREKGTIPGTYKTGSGEVAIANYFRNKHGIEIGVNNEELKKIASTDRTVTEVNLKALIDSPEFKEAAKEAAAEKATAEKAKLQNKDKATLNEENFKEIFESTDRVKEINILFFVQDKSKITDDIQKMDEQNLFNFLRSQKENLGIDSITGLGELLAKSLEQEQQAAAAKLIISAYNASKGKGADEFVKELFGPEALPLPRNEKISELVPKAKEIFEDINRYYRGSTIKDLNQIMSDKPRFAENLQDFAIKCVRFLPNLFGAGIKTNAEVRSDFKTKSEAIDKKSLLDHAAKKPSSPTLSK